MKSVYLCIVSKTIKDSNIMATPQEISKVFNIRQLSRYKILRAVEAGDLALIRVKDEPSVYNNYSRAIHTYLIKLNGIISKEQEHNDVYKFDVYDDGCVRSNWTLEKWQMLSIVPISITDEIYQRTKDKVEKQIACEKKHAEERAEQRRRDEEQMRIFKENLRKQEEADRLARIQVEEERRAEPMMITVGMYEDLMKQLSDLQETVSNLEGSVRGLQYRCYGPGMDE